MDNIGDNASGAAGLSEEQRPDAESSPEAAELWLASEGTRIVTEQLQENRNLAATKIARWRDQELGGDACALVGIIRAADKAGVFGLRFLNLIVDGIRAAHRQKTAQQELPIRPVPVSERKLG